MARHAPHSLPLIQSVVKLGAVPLCYLVKVTGLCDIVRACVEAGGERSLLRTSNSNVFLCESGSIFTSMLA